MMMQHINWGMAAFTVAVVVIALVSLWGYERWQPLWP